MHVICWEFIAFIISRFRQSTRWKYFNWCYILVSKKKLQYNTCIYRGIYNFRKEASFSRWVGDTGLGGWFLGVPRTFSFLFTMERIHEVRQSPLPSLNPLLPLLAQRPPVRSPHPVSPTTAALSSASFSSAAPRLNCFAVGDVGPVGRVCLQGL